MAYSLNKVSHSVSAAKNLTSLPRKNWRQPSSSKACAECRAFSNHSHLVELLSSQGRPKIITDVTACHNEREILTFDRRGRMIHTLALRF